MRISIYSIVINMVFFCSLIFSNTIDVPKDYLKIQDAIKAASAGDTILVDQGIYVENIDFLGKEITVKSRLGPEVTIIDANMIDSGVVFINGETEKAVLDGFTIKNGSGYIFDTFNNRGGGGIYCFDSTPKIVNNIIINNKSNIGGGVGCFGDKCNPEISSCYIANNHVINNKCGGYGGGIACNYCSAIIFNCEIKNNSSVSIGGGIYAAGYSGAGKPLIKNNKIIENISLSHGAGKGGGIGCKNGPNPQIENNIISGNIAGGGAGISIYDGIIINNIILNNVAQIPNGAGTGGGIRTIGLYTEICDNIIINNSALLSGGGICWAAYSGKIINNIICYNQASGATCGLTISGGGISFGQSLAGKTQLSNCVIANNYSEEIGGGICFYYKSSIEMLNNTLSTNKADISGSGIYLNRDSNLTIGNSIVYDNINDEIAYETVCPSIAYSNIKGGWPGTGNIDSDPMFADPFNLDFHIKYNSPCKDAGDKTIADLPGFDFENDPRIAWGEVDMGADEFFNHLYYVGLPSHGNPIDVKITGQPGLASLWICLSMKAKKIPQSTKWGNWYLEFPIVGPVLLGQIPAVEGIFVLPGIIPTTPAGQYDFHMQVLIGQDLTNCCTVEVK